MIFLSSEFSYAKWGSFAYVALSIRKSHSECPGGMTCSTFVGHSSKVCVQRENLMFSIAIDLATMLILHWGGLCDNGENHFPQGLPFGGEEDA